MDLALAFDDMYVSFRPKYRTVVDLNICLNPLGFDS
jgi:hypothetical protein